MEMNFLELNTHGVTEQNEVSTATDGYVEDIIYRGWTTIPDVLSADEISEIKQTSLEVYERQASEIGEEELAKMNDQFIIRSPFCYEDAFVKLAAHPALMSVCKGIFGENFVLIMQNGIINSPTSLHYQRRWHRDLNYQHWVSSKTLCVNALFALTDFNAVTGGTNILPGTHMHEKFPSERYVRENEIGVVIPAGSLVMMNSMVFHRTGLNTSGENRIGINHVIGLPFFAQQVSIPDCLELKPEYEEFAAYFGFRWMPAKSPSDWRKRKI